MKMQMEIAPTDSTALYKNSTKLNQPITDHKHLQFIEAYNDEKVLLGACNLNGRLWNGSVWLYNDLTNFDKINALVSSTTESSVCDAVFLETDKFVVVEDSGVLQILQVILNPVTQSKQIQCLGYTCQHDDTILSASAFHKKTRIITAGIDCCIKIWNLEDLLAERSYESAHRKIISCLDTKPRSNDIFASAGLDGEALVWDVRQESPAQVIYSNSGHQLRAIAWRPSDDNALVIGSVDGGVTLIDTRKPQDFVMHSGSFKKSIHKIKFDPKRPHLLATCSDDTDLKVLDTNQHFATIYHDQRHNDFVRGITWFDENLLSCAWDNTVLRHIVRETSSATLPVHDQ
ncbi:methylosome protein 50-like [Venturia canescens]|uniref:methylosome protein 50-like n=1 Tax=Venturia canescens TaxID=32260 RepID=UPI001C9BEBC1|nr:methylosome protein 50-like [Venturia canescens]